MDDRQQNRRKYLSEVVKQLSWLTQLGLSLITPVLLCILGCSFLCSRFGIGGWIYIPGFILGLGASFMTAYKFYLSESAKGKKDKDKRKPGYNRHT
ncbi:MAG: AtpZ/AtpI family protein [Lachnospiraceae bacterium]|nr:AtpZ/AtpI family protein [Lachnospiraceae bacterium]